MRVAFIEDSFAANFHPLTLARPVFELVCGQHSLRERIVRHCLEKQPGQRFQSAQDIAFDL